MALALDISADMELLLHKQGAIRDQDDVTAYLPQLVEKDIAADLSECAGLEDVDAGRTIAFEDVVAQGTAKREQRRAAREGKQTA